MIMKFYLCTRPVIEKRISRYAAGEIHFNLMAVVGDRLAMLEKRLSQLKKKIAEREEQHGDSMDTDEGKHESCSCLHPSL